MNAAALYLHGDYPEKHRDFYVSLADSRTVVAVDGGLRFVREAGLKPDIVLGDFDSLGAEPFDEAGGAEIVTFDRRKDYTDAELALRLCLERGARAVDIVNPSVDEADHFLGNIMLLNLVPDQENAHVRVINHRYEIGLLRDSRATYHSCKGAVLSVIPLSANIRLTTSGTEYTAHHERLTLGSSTGLRNLIVADRATVTVDGRALVYRSLGR